MGFGMLNLVLDKWQKEVLEYEGNIALRSGRQVGKSTVISIKAGEFAVKNKNKLVMIVAATERQARLLFEKTLGYLADKYRSKILTGLDRPTKHEINLRNGSRILCLPTGLTGYGIRGYTVDLLIVDEAAFVNDEVFRAVTPELSVSGGKLVLLSTPFGKAGYFYDCFSDPNFKTWHISAEDCPRHNKDFLEREKQRMTKLQYAQEYLGEFVDELRQFFPTELIKKCMTLERDTISYHIANKYDNFLGVDVAAMGEDETVLCSLARINREKLKMIDLQITTKTLITDTIRKIKAADLRHNYKRIYIDDGGLGVGVFHPLLEDEQTRRKVVAINNASRSLNRDKTQRKKLLKEDLYFNLLRLMEKCDIELFKTPEIFHSLKSVQYEVDPVTKNTRIFGNYTHIAEALIRAAWCMDEKALNIWIRYT